MAKRLYLLPFDHRETFAPKLFGWQGPLNAEHAEEIGAAKQVIYDGFQAAVAGGIQKEHAAILADESIRKSYGISLTLKRDDSYANMGLTVGPRERLLRSLGERPPVGARSGPCQRRSRPPYSDFRYSTRSAFCLAVRWSANSWS